MLLEESELDHAFTSDLTSTESLSNLRPYFGGHRLVSFDFLGEKKQAHEEKLDEPTKEGLVASLNEVDWIMEVDWDVGMKWKIRSLTSMTF
jgi:hypothetical protein